ncbi:amidohydrolase family protein [Flavobacteriaceae bacterium Ap0902]|nr:amidohydrolase family protein [Flavobacteriaceae bacterium Ap0902]
MRYDAVILNGQLLMPDGEVKKGHILIKDHRISKIKFSSERDINAYKATVKIDAKNKFVMPGLIDAHAHFISLGRNASNLDLLGVPTWRETLEKVKERVANAEPGEWIIGRGWHQEKWFDTPAQTVEGFPVHDELSAISPNNPIILNHASGHGILANAKAMELAGVSGNSEVPEGGDMILKSNGEPSGIFQENAENLVYKAYQKFRSQMSEEEKEEEWYAYLKMAEDLCLSQGITSVHDAGLSYQDGLKFKALADENRLNVRLHTMMADYIVQEMDRDTLKNYVESTRDNLFFDNTAIKAYMDGALGSRGAWLLDDYTDKPGYRGENVTPISSIKKTAGIAKELDMQLCVHAIGDRGNREVMNVFEAVAGDEIPARRWRIEHAQHLNPQDIKRFGELGIIASMQTVHCTSDAPYVVKRLGEERAEEGAYVWQKLLENNVILANGTDAPIEKINPFRNLYAALTRKPANDTEAFYPSQVLNRKQALKMYTQGNAYAEFKENEKGKLEKGYLADIIILNRNLMECPVEDIPETQVVLTMVDGEIKYLVK